MFIERFAGFLPKGNLKKAIGFMNKGQYRKAIKEFECCICKKAGVAGGTDQELLRMYIVEAYIEYSKELENNGKYPESARQLEKAIEIQPDYADVHYKLAKMHEFSGNNVNSRESIKRALIINSEFFKARIMLAKSYYDSGNRARATEELDISLTAVPNFFKDSLDNLIREIRIGHGDPEITSLFERLLEEKPSSSQVSKQIALKSIHNCDYDHAITEMKKALSLNPDYPDLHNLLGIAYANSDMLDDAIMEFETALKVNPDYLKARMNMALTLYEKGQREDSMYHLKIVLKMDPENELAKNLLAELQPELNRR